MLLAHPVTETVALGVAPAFVAMLTTMAATGLLLLSRRRRRVAAPVVGVDEHTTGGVDEHTAEGVDERTPVEGEPDAPSRGAGVGRVVGGALLVLAVVAGRLGSPEQLRNIATALVIGVGWPALLLASTVADPWGRLAPFDGIARLLERLSGPEPVMHVPDRTLDLIGLLGALGWTWWLGAYQPGLQPRAIGAALGLYALATWTGCILVGRRRWLRRAEVFTVLFATLDRLRRGRTPAPSTTVMSTLAVLLGGLVFAELRFSRWYLSDITRVGLLPFSEPSTVLGYLGVVGIALVSVHGCLRWGRRVGSAASVVGVTGWLIVGAGLSAAVERDRLWTSAQVLVTRISDPLGMGVDLLGTAEGTVWSWPFGDVGRLAVQLALLVLPLGLAVARRSVPTQGDRRAEPAVVMVVLWVTVAAMSAATL